METIPTNQGKLTIPEIMRKLSYSSYETNRNLGMTHEQLLSIGIGDDEFKAAYEQNKPVSTNETSIIQL